MMRGNYGMPADAWYVWRVKPGAPLPWSGPAPDRETAERWARMYNEQHAWHGDRYEVRQGLEVTK